MAKVYRCPVCGGRVEFSVVLGWNCQSCKTIFGGLDYDVPIFYLEPYKAADGAESGD